MALMDMPMRRRVWIDGHAADRVYNAARRRIVMVMLMFGGRAHRS
jgi:hypothetical protein